MPMPLNHPQNISSAGQKGLTFSNHFKKNMNYLLHD